MNNNTIEAMNNNNQQPTRKTARELMLLLSDVGETISSFAYALEMAMSLKDNKITSREFELLSGDLQLHCKRNKIETSNEICSLF